MKRSELSLLFFCRQCLLYLRVWLWSGGVAEQTASNPRFNILCLFSYCFSVPSCPFLIHTNTSMDITRCQVAFGGYDVDNRYQHCDYRRFGASAVGVCLFIVVIVSFTFTFDY